MTTLLVLGGLAWWFIGMVTTRLIWRNLPSEPGTFRYEWGPYAKVAFFVFSLTGPLTLYIHASGWTADRLEESRARKQVREEMVAERNKLRVQYYEKLLAAEGIQPDKMDEFDLDTDME